MYYPLCYSFVLTSILYHIKSKGVLFSLFDAQLHYAQALGNFAPETIYNDMALYSRISGCEWETEPGDGEFYRKIMNWKNE